MAKKNRGAAKAVQNIYNIVRKSTKKDEEGNVIPPLVVADALLTELYGPKMDKLSPEKRKEFVIGKMKSGRTLIKNRLVKIEGVNVPVERETGDDDVTHIFLLKTNEHGKAVKGLDGKPIRIRELAEGEYTELNPPTFWENKRKNSEVELLDCMLDATADL